MSKESRTYIPVGGQAIIEGIAMKGPKKTCIAIRQPDGTVITEIEDTKKNPFEKIPVLRGAAALVMSLVNGYGYISKSADIAFSEEIEPETKFEKWLNEKFGEKLTNYVMVFAAVLGVAIALTLFTVLPTFLAGVLAKLFGFTAGIAVVESVFKLVIFALYLFLVTRTKEVHRVFEYHGAEHKTISCIEAGDELTVENVRKHSRFHPRCGTSFLFFFVFVSIIVFSLIPWTGVISRSLLKIVLMPVVIGIAYEIIQFAGKHDNGFSRVFSAPGLAIQRLTTFEPDDEQIEVAILAISKVLPGSEEE